MSTADRQTNELAATPPTDQGRAEEPRAGFFARRWQGLAPVGTVLWRDMIVVGTAINLAMAFVSLMALGFKAPAWVAMAIFVAPLPYNFFLVVALWRSIARQVPRNAGTIRAAALLWLALMAIV